MKTTIYHGSEKILEKPIYGYGKKYNDYGLGFYCTQNLELAKEWSVDEHRNGYANEYEIDTDGLTVLNLNSDEYCMLHWLTLLLKNRTFDTQAVLAREGKEYLLKNFDVPLEKVDIVIGYRADDSYFSFAQDFLNGTISYRQLANAMRLGKLGEQFVLISKKAFDKLTYVQTEEADRKEWYPKRTLRDQKARNEYFSCKRNKREKGDLYITAILDEEIKANDERLR